MAKKNIQLSRKEIFTMLFDIATTGRHYEYYDWALEQVFGPGDYTYKLIGKERIEWCGVQVKAREKLFELFIKE